MLDISHYMTIFSTLFGKSRTGSFLPRAFTFRSAVVTGALAVSLFFASESNAQCLDLRDADSLTNAGTEFLLCFEQNEQDGIVNDSLYQEIYIASLGDSATVEITSRASAALQRTFKIGPNESIIHRIPPAIDMLINTSEFVDDRVVRVSSTSPIVCYGLNHKLYTADAFLALPRSTAGLEFRVMSYQNSIAGAGTDIERPSQFAVAAFQDNTIVTIIPSAATRGGRQALQPFTITLNAAQCVQVQARPLVEGLDLTGSIVRSDKPVTVYGSHVRSEIPSFNSADPRGISRDHLTEAIPPVSTWGRRFIIADYPYPGTDFEDLFRVLALNPNTRVTVDGQPWKTLGENEYADSLYKGFHTIEADGPVLVGTYSHSTQDPQLGQNELGDPDFVIIPPVDQTYNDFTFFNSTDVSYQQHFALVVTEITGKSRVSLDGSLQSPIIFRDLPAFANGSQYAIARIGIDAGFHRIRTLNTYDKGILLTTYGFGFVDSYGYTAGALFKPTNSIVKIHANHLTPENPTNANELIIRNIWKEVIFFDSVKLELYGDAGKKYKVRLKEDLRLGIRELGKGEMLALHFIVEPPLEEQITGVLRFSTHTPKWHGLDVASAELTLNPQAVASVEDDILESGVRIVHDVSGQAASLVVNAERSTTVSAHLYDIAGRRVQTVAENALVTGSQKFVIHKGLLPSGFYFVEVSCGNSQVRKSFTVAR